MRESDWSKVLGWPGYKVYRHEVNEPLKTLKLWVRRKRGNRKLVCSGCGRKLAEAYDSYEREVRDLPCFEFRTTVVVELYRVRCADCRVKTEKVPQLPSKAPFSKRFGEAVVSLAKCYSVHDPSGFLVALRFCDPNKTPYFRASSLQIPFKHKCLRIACVQSQLNMPTSRSLPSFWLASLFRS